MLCFSNYISHQLEAIWYCEPFWRTEVLLELWTLTRLSKCFRFSLNLLYSNTVSLESHASCKENVGPPFLCLCYWLIQPCISLYLEQDFVCHCNYPIRPWNCLPAVTLLSDAQPLDFWVSVSIYKGSFIWFLLWNWHSVRWMDWTNWGH